MKIFTLYNNDKPYHEVVASKMQDLKEDFINTDKAFFSDAKITCKQTGVLVKIGAGYKKVMFDESAAFKDAIKSLTNLQLSALLNNDFDNDNNSFYLNKKDFLLDDRKTLSDRGLEFVTRIRSNLRR